MHMVQTTGFRLHPYTGHWSGERGTHCSWGLLRSLYSGVTQCRSWSPGAVIDSTFSVVPTKLS